MLALSTRPWTRRHVVAHSPFVICVPLSHRRRQSVIASWFISRRFPFGEVSASPATEREGSEFIELGPLGRAAGARLVSILGTPVNPRVTLGTAVGAGGEV